MEIRFAQAGDIPGLLALLRQVGLVHHNGRPDIFRANAQKYSASQIIAMLENPKTPIFAAVEGDRVLGYCFCIRKVHKDDPVISDHEELYIDDLCVDEACRGQHIGKALFEHAKVFAREQGCYNVTLNVWSCNESAMRFYERCGLKPQKVGLETVLEEPDAGKE